MKALLCSLMLGASALAMAAKPDVIPELKQWTDAPEATAPFTLTDATTIRVIGDDAALKAYADQFAQDVNRTVTETKFLEKIFGSCNSTIVLSADLKDEALGEEGYILEVAPHTITIKANTPLGAFWGTRSLLQVFHAQNNTFPAGEARDWPTYKIRGFMFDAGRKPFALTTLRQIIDIMSYYKMNDFQVHLSDNYIWLHNAPGVQTPEDVLKQDPTYGAFRLESKHAGLTATDISYTKDDYRALEAYAKARGVNLIPEIDVPGHALPMVRIRPDLMYKGSVGNKHNCERAAMLDLSNPETFPFIASIFDEYIDENVFGGEVVHIGTDEYYGDAESYRAFADKMLKHIIAKGKTPRLWGSLTWKKGKTPVQVEGVQMHIWSMQWQNPVDAVNAGYDIINILDMYGYSVPSGNGSKGAYGDDINAHWVYDHWTPTLFPNVKPEQLDQSKILGGAWAVWNDNSFLTDPGLCGRDLLANIRTNCAVYAQKTWCAAISQTYADFLQDLEAVGTPVDVSVPTWEKTWTVTRQAETKDALILAQGEESTIYAVSPINGNIGFKREGAHYTFDVALPVGEEKSITFKVTPRKTELILDGVTYLPKRQHWAESCKYYTLPKPE